MVRDDADQSIVAWKRLPLPNWLVVPIAIGMGLWALIGGFYLLALIMAEFGSTIYRMSYSVGGVAFALVGIVLFLAIIVSLKLYQHRSRQRVVLGVDGVSLGSELYPWNSVRFRAVRNRGWVDTFGWVDKYLLDIEIRGSWFIVAPVGGIWEKSGFDATIRMLADAGAEDVSGR